MLPLTQSPKSSSAHNADKNSNRKVTFNICKKTMKLKKLRSLSCGRHATDMPAQDLGKWGWAEKRAEKGEDSREIKLGNLPLKSRAVVFSRC